MLAFSGIARRLLLDILTARMTERRTMTASWSRAGKDAAEGTASVGVGEMVRGFSGDRGWWAGGIYVKRS